MPIFTPPFGSYTPRVGADTPEDQIKPMVFAKAEISRGKNIFILKDNTVVEGSPIWHNVKYAYYGQPTNISGEEVTILTAAGYGANITTGVV
jgi:hypothetical protein